jgi:hypothetical protein
MDRRSVLKLLSSVPLAASPGLACPCRDGWLCESHPDRPEGHDGCTAPGVTCLAPSCRHGQFWLRQQIRDEAYDRERALTVESTLHLDRLAEPPRVMRYAMHRDERIRCYGSEFGVPYHVGDVLALDDFRRFVRVTAVVSANLLTVRPYQNEVERRTDDAYLAGAPLAT